MEKKKFVNNLTVAIVFLNIALVVLKLVKEVVKD